MVFEKVVQKLIEIGVYDYLLPFILVTALTYALLRKIKVLGESAFVNGVVALSIGFMFFAVPQIMGVSVAKPLIGFFSQGVVALVVLMIGFLIAGFFYPNIFEKMAEGAKGGGMIWWFVIFAVLLAIFSGLFNFIISPMMKLIGSGKDIFIGIFFLLVFIGILAAISSGGKD